MTISYKARAPLRLGFGGGGTDVSPYSDEFGGCVLNATIDLFSYCSIVPRNDQKICFQAADCHKSYASSLKEHLPLEGDLILHKATYNRIVRDFNQGKPLPCNITTHSDAPIGSGLGTSSTMVVAILGAFKEWLGLPLKKDEIAHLAFEIERKELGLAGGKQDQYSAVFGGINFMEFLPEDRVIVHPLTVKKTTLENLEKSLILYYTGVSRDSSTIISEQINNVKIKAPDPLLAMHALKKNAEEMKRYLLAGDLDSFAKELRKSWESKKKMASTISNSDVEHLFEIAMNAGAIAGKMSGAGGGGYVMFMVEQGSKEQLINELKKGKGQLQSFEFVKTGLEVWKA